MYSLPKNVYRERIDFSKIKTTVPIPNLIEIQKKSYERFLQMNRLASEREDAGLQSVFKSVFPISDFRENSSLEFIEYSIGNWECKCGKLQGLHHLRKPCAGCGNVLIADPYGDREVLCPRCGRPNIVEGDVCDICGNTVALKLKYDVDECQERGMTFAVPLKVTIRLVVWNKDPETGREDHPRHQGAGGLLRRHPADDRERHVHHQRHRARHRVAAPSLAGRVLPLRRQDAVRRADHSVPRLVGRVRVRREEPAVCPHRPEAQVPGDRLPPRTRPARRRRDHPELLHRRQDLPAEGLEVLGGQREPRRAARGQGHHDSEVGHRRFRRARRSPTPPSRRCARRTSKPSRSRTPSSRARLPPPTS